MADKNVADKLLNNLVETLADNVPKQKSVSFFEEGTSSVTTRLNRLFGRQKPLHHLLGGGKSADVLLWRNKKISASVLTGATAIWILFEWLNYHFLTLVFFALALGMIVQFVWANASGLMKSSSSDIPRLKVPNEIFVNISKTVGAEVNRGLQLLQDVSCEGSLKQFIGVVLCLWLAAVIGSWCNFLTVFYIGFIGAHTLPVLYERYEDQVDDFVYSLLDQLQHHYRKVDAGVFNRVLSRIPKGKKHD